MARLITIKRNNDFKAAYKKGFSIGSSCLVLYCRRNFIFGQGARFGFTVSKKIGGAVQRNRVKRVLREACRVNQSRFPSGFDFVFVAKPACLKINLTMAENVIFGLLNKCIAKMEAKKKD